MAGNKVYFQLDPVKTAAFLKGPNGPVARELITAGEMVRQEAKRLVGVSEPDPVPRKKPRRPGTLRDSIVSRLTFKGGDPAVMVGSELEYARFHHDGTGPHTIAPRSAPRLVFFSKKRGRVIYMPPGKPVNHPGTRANPFLTKALQVLKRRYS